MPLPKHYNEQREQKRQINDGFTIGLAYAGLVISLVIVLWSRS